MNRNHTITQLRPNVWEIDEFGLDTAYLIAGSERALLIDTGTGAGDLRGVAESLISTPYDVVATHGHVDHVGGVGQFSRLYIHPADIEYTKELSVEARRGYAQSMLSTLPDDTVPPFSLEDITAREQEPEYLPVETGFQFDLGDKQITVIECPGHTPGSICLLDPADRILISGDNLQPLLLILAPGEDRMEVVRNWLKGAREVLSHREEFDIVCGGHGLVESSQVEDLLQCGEGIVDGTIPAKRVKIHIFDGMFAQYRDVYITYDPDLL